MIKARQSMCPRIGPLRREFLDTPTFNLYYLPERRLFALLWDHLLNWHDRWSIWRVLINPNTVTIRNRLRNVLRDTLAKTLA